MSQSGLLPEGLRDVLPPYAEAEALLLRQVLDSVAAHGYERVSPPLVEFEESLTGRLGAEKARGLFRFMDPNSQGTLALRADMTPQVARIAAHRLGHLARPLRLSYGGLAVRVKGTQLRADRQFMQAGAELIGTDSAAAVRESVEVALDALAAIGLEGVTLDVTMPDLLAALLAKHQVPADRAAQISASVDAKDAGSLAQLGASWALPLIAAAGPLGKARDVMTSQSADGVLSQRLDRVLAVIEPLAQSHPHVQLTLDPAEQQGFQFQSWFGFSLFANGVRGEVGRGGSYQVTGGAAPEAAVGFSLYLDGLVDAGRGIQARRRVLLPAGTAREIGHRLRADGWVTVAQLEPNEDMRRAALTQRCSHWLNGSQPQPVD